MPYLCDFLEAARWLVCERGSWSSKALLKILKRGLAALLLAHFFTINDGGKTAPYQSQKESNSTISDALGGGGGGERESLASPFLSHSCWFTTGKVLFEKVARISLCQIVFQMYSQR